MTDRQRRNQQRLRRAIQKAAVAYFDAIHAAHGHLNRYPDLDNADFRAWLDYSGTGRNIGNEVGDAAAVLAEDCPDCSIFEGGELEDWEIEEKRLSFDERAEAERRLLAEQAERQAIADEIMIDLGLRDDPRKKLGDRLGGFIPDELRDDDDLIRNVKKS
jgi:hypothetical protein